MKKGRKRCAGRVFFTLIELLVVMAIISILAAMLMPALTTARFRIRITTCTTTHRRMYLATTMYVGDWNGRMPDIRQQNWVYADQLATSARSVSGFRKGTGSASSWWGEGLFAAMRYLEAEDILCPDFDYRTGTNWDYYTLLGRIRNGVARQRYPGERRDWIGQSTYIFYSFAFWDCHLTDGRMQRPIYKSHQYSNPTHTGLIMCYSGDRYADGDNRPGGHEKTGGVLTYMEGSTFWIPYPQQGHFRGNQWGNAEIRAHGFWGGTWLNR